MSIYTRSQFAQVAREKAGLGGLRGYVNETRYFSATTATTSVFLSHSHHDKDVVEQAKIFFENLGIRIYVDWADSTMPESTSGTPALKIKDQITRKNDKFILLATNRAVSSKWCNWEVGIADHSKLHRNKMALLPLAENSSAWDGNEYLQIYPSIEHVKARTRVSNGSFVPEGDYVLWPSDRDGSRKYVTLDEWLRQ